jgi:hypothetical protein
VTWQTIAKRPQARLTLDSQQMISFMAGAEKAELAQ